MQAVDRFTPEWMSTPVHVPTPKSTASYAGRLMSRPKESANNNAQTAQHRDEKLLKKTSLKYCKNAASRKTRPYRKDADSQVLDSKDHRTTKTAVTAINCCKDGRQGLGWDAKGCHDNSGDLYTEYENVSPDDVFHPTWMSPREPLDVPDKTDQESTENEPEQAQVSGEKTRKNSKAGKAWRRKVIDLIDTDGNRPGKFAPIWMTRTALSKSGGADDGNTQVPSTQRAGAYRVIGTPEGSDPSTRKPPLFGEVSHDEGPNCALTKSKSLSHHVSRPSTEAQIPRDIKSCKTGDTSVPPGESIEVGVPSGEPSKSSEESAKTDSDDFQSGFITNPSPVRGTGDARSQLSLNTLPACLNASFERRLDCFIFHVLLTAVLSVLVEAVVEDSLREVEDEILSATELWGFMREANLSIWPSDENSLQSDDSCLGRNDLSNGMYGSPTACVGSADELMTDETPPWASDETLTTERSLINACLQHDAQEHGYAASVAVLDGGDKEGLMTDVILLWTSDDEDSFFKYGDCSPPPWVNLDGPDDGAEDEFAESDSGIA